MRIGIIGAGQLGQMLGDAARDLNAKCCFLDPSDNPPAAICGDVIQCAFDDTDALARLVERCDVITYEFENVSVDALHRIGNQTQIYPPVAALAHAQDRLHEKQLFADLEIPIPAYHRIDSRAEMDAAAARLGLPMIVKTRRLGYDGKGQFIVNNAADLNTAWKRLGGNALIAEQWVAYDFEVSCIGARNVDGEMAVYPLSRNLHIDGILRTSIAPLDSQELTGIASSYVTRLLDRLRYVGVLALELFVVGDVLLANEFAPRVHNSGHWTIEGSKTSQFENHLRGIMNLPLGPTAGLGHAGMVNLIGKIPDDLTVPKTGVLHNYRKLPRPGRKLGHITVVAATAGERDSLVGILDKSVTQST